MLLYMSSKQLTCKTEKVLAFYRENPNINFSAMNAVFVDIMASLMESMNSSLTTNIATKLMDKVDTLHKDLSVVSDNVGKIHQNLLMNITNKLNDIKKEYVDTIKMVMTNHTVEHIVPNIKECTTSMHEKTVGYINDAIPKNNHSVIKEIKTSMDAFAAVIHTDTKAFIETNNSSSITPQTLNDFTSSVDSKITCVLNSFQQSINSSIQASEQRLDNKLTDVREIASNEQAANSITQQHISDLLKKMEISSVKGKCSENILFNILHGLYPSAQIDFVGDQKETGDIILRRKNKPSILIENKSWNKNVVQDEVKKFIRDVETQKCCGLFLSQNYGIANKENFEIDIHNRHVLLYVHEVNNDAEKIKMAINIIDNFKSKLDETAEIDGENYSIDKDVLDDINKEYQQFASQQILQIRMIKDFSQKLSKQIDEASLPSLKNFLSTRYAFSSTEYTCDICGYGAKNKSALAAHKRGKDCKIAASLKPPDAPELANV
jgi:hypothetical protein